MTESTMTDAERWQELEARANAYMNLAHRHSCKILILSSPDGFFIKVISATDGEIAIAKAEADGENMAIRTQRNRVYMKHYMRKRRAKRKLCGSEPATASERPTATLSG